MKLSKRSVGVIGRGNLGSDDFNDDLSAKGIWKKNVSKFSGRKRDSVVLPRAPRVT